MPPCRRVNGREPVRQERLCVSVAANGAFHEAEGEQGETPLFLHGSILSLRENGTSRMMQGSGVSRDLFVHVDGLNLEDISAEKGYPEKDRRVLMMGEATHISVVPLTEEHIVPTDLLWSLNLHVERDGRVRCVLVHNHVGAVTFTAEVTPTGVAHSIQTAP